MADSRLVARRTVLGGKFKIISLDNGQMRAKCTLCDKNLKYHHSTSSLKYHLNNKHPFTSTEIESHSQPSLTLNNLDSQSHSQTCNPSQPQLWNYVRRKTSTAEESNIAKALCLWIGQDMRPLSIIEDKGLVQLLRVATGNPEFKLPGRTSLFEKLKDLYQQKAQEVAKCLDKADSIVIAIDYWTSISNQSYLGVSAFYMEDWKLKCVTLGIDHSSDQHTAENIKTQVQAVIDRWQLSAKIKHLMSDNAFNVVKAARLLNLTHMPCLAHTLQLSIRHALEEAGINATLSKCRKIVGHYKHSSIRAEELKEIHYGQAQTDDDGTQPTKTKASMLVSPLINLINFIM